MSVSLSGGSLASRACRIEKDAQILYLCYGPLLLVLRQRDVQVATQRGQAMEVAGTLRAVWCPYDKNVIQVVVNLPGSLLPYHPFNSVSKTVKDVWH